MLNDRTRVTRICSFAVTLGAGLMLGALLLLSGHETVWLGMFGVGMAIMCLASIGEDHLSRRADRSLCAEIVRGSTEIVTGTVIADLVPARVARRRLVKGPPFLLGHPGPLPGKGFIIVATALVDGPARRVGALVPADLLLQLRKGHPVALAVHPVRPEVAVLDPSVDSDQLARIAGDPRWWEDGIPTDLSISGGLLGRLGAYLAGLVVGIGVNWLVAQVFFG
ncbi:MAG: hypothetical protein JWO76_2124 [Nocardioides sp.]|jgi:hypothetical protein|nr:hypothetical protein [Nocardioides sp.]